MSIPPSIEPAVISRLKILADMDITEKRRPQDGHITMRIEGREINMRVSTIPTYLGEKLVIRILDESNVLRGLQQLGLEKEDENKLRSLISKPNGLILVTGPIGSGKTTTLYACLNSLDIFHNNISTIEDPIEYRLAGINQMQVNYSIGLDFVAGLRAILRQDVDVIMVGEVRDSETAKVATWAALTGQLVFCTLHTKDSASAVTMMSNLGVENFFLSSCLEGIIAQRLVRKICPKCKEYYKPDKKILEKLNLQASDDMKFARGLGCEYCNQTGFYDRTGIFEILVVDEEIKKLILNEVPDTEIKKVAISKGMKTLWDNGIKKILDGITTPEEVLREVTLR